MRAEVAKARAEAAGSVFRAAGVPGIRYDGLEERFAALNVAPTAQQIVEVMYPGDAGAQRLALQAFTAKAAGGVKGGVPGVESDMQGVQSSWWEITKCVGAIGAFIAGNALLAAKLTKPGGIYRGAKLVVQAGDFQDRMKALVAVFGDVTGLGTVASYCS
ncbi:hypothetical protein ACWC5I_44255 [Kitasatospora sp. NPDC001574]